MSSPTVERPRTQRDPVRPQHDRLAEEARRPTTDEAWSALTDRAWKNDTRGAGIATPEPGPHAGFDADLNPIDDEFINTRGSER